MKRIYFSLLLLALSIAGALYQFWYVSSKSDEFTKRIEEIDVYLRNNGEHYVTSVDHGMSLYKGKELEERKRLRNGSQKNDETLRR